MKHILSKGANRKLARDIGVLNLPHGITCPGMTKVCSEVCYAAKAERMYPSCRNFRERTYLLSQSVDFGEKLAAEVKARKFTKVRFQESGDVYDQEYLGKLFEACRANPRTKFLMYTKSFHLDWSGKPANLALYWSVDSSTAPSVIPAGGVKAYLVDKGAKAPAGVPTCVHKSAKHYCGSECSTCWVGVSDVYFNRH